MRLEYDVRQYIDASFVSITTNSGVNPRTPSRPLHTDREWSTYPASTTTSLSRPGILHGHPSTPSWQTYNHYSPSQSSSSPTISISSSSSGSSTQSSGTEGSRGSITPRVKRTTVRTKPQVSPKDVPPFEARPEQYKCPLCEYVQTNRRIPDLKKHHELHFRDHYATRQGEAWVCCGIPIALAAELGLVDKGRVEQRDRGVMVGGCGQAFSNKDNYRRHLRDAGCFGDHDGSWVPGNAK